jgi:hypothetical protein
MISVEIRDGLYLITLAEFIQFETDGKEALRQP